MQPRLRASLMIGAIAVASALAGAAIDRTFLVHPPRHRPRVEGNDSLALRAARRSEMLDHLDRDVKLTAAQRVAIDSIFQHTDSILRALRQETQPRVQQAIERSRSEISARLDPEQREKFAKRMAEKDKLRRAPRP